MTNFSRGDENLGRRKFRPIFFWPIRKVLLKSGIRNFQNSPSFGRTACFYGKISGNFKRFQYFNFETDFLENENLFQKIGVPFLVESTEIEITSFPYKTAI